VRVPIQIKGERRGGDQRKDGKIKSSCQIKKKTEAFSNGGVEFITEETSR